MFRRAVSSLMLVGFVAGQWAAMPHAHAAPVSAEHQDRLHVHLSGHEHSHGGSTHTHLHPPDSPAASQAEDATDSFASIGIEHDADAIYLASSSCESSNRGNAGASADFTSDWLMPTSVASTTFDSSASAAVPPEEMATTFARCLEMRALRI